MWLRDVIRSPYVLLRCLVSRRYYYVNAAMRGDVEAVQRHLRSGVPVDVKSLGDMTAMRGHALTVTRMWSGCCLHMGPTRPVACSRRSKCTDRTSSRCSWSLVRKAEARLVYTAELVQRLCDIIVQRKLTQVRARGWPSCMTSCNTKDEK